MQNTASVLEYKMHKLVWDLEMKTDHLTLVRRSDLIRIDKKRTNRMVESAVIAVTE